MQLEFQVSYAAAVKRLYDIGFITFNHKSELFNERNSITSKSLFRMLQADERLLRSADIVQIPSRYYEYVISNYNNGYIPYASLEKALALIGIDAKVLKKEEKNDDELNIDDIFEEFE